MDGPTLPPFQLQLRCAAAAPGASPRPNATAPTFTNPPIGSQSVLTPLAVGPETFACASVTPTASAAARVVGLVGQTSATGTVVQLAFYCSSDPPPPPPAPQPPLPPLPPPPPSPPPPAPQPPFVPCADSPLPPFLTNPTSNGTGDPPLTSYPPATLSSCPGRAALGLCQSDMTTLRSCPASCGLCLAGQAPVVQQWLCLPPNFAAGGTLLVTVTTDPAVREAGGKEGLGRGAVSVGYE